jgi:hypothetical protein
MGYSIDRPCRRIVCLFLLEAGQRKIEETIEVVNQDSRVHDLTALSYARVAGVS